jgi:Superinfection immunity protein
MIFLSLLAFLYFLPTILAVRRGHEVAPVLLLNLFLGWTGIGWLILLLWAILSWPPYGYAYPPPPVAYYGYPPNYWRR